MNAHLPVSGFVKKFTGILILFFFVTTSFSLFAQQYEMTVPPQRVSPDSVEISRKAALSASYSLSSWNGTYSSDYYVHFKWTDFYFQCDCSSGSYNVKLTIGGKAYYPGWFNGKTYSGYGCRVGLGPSRYGTYRFVNYEGGDHGYFLFGCVSDCNANWNITSDAYYSTGNIRPPISPKATVAKYDYRINLEWGKTTDIPDADHGYIIFRDGVELAKVFNGVRKFDDMTCGPNETHTYTIQTIWPDNANYTHISSSVIVTGSTFDLDLNASLDKPNSVKLTWNNIAGIKGKNDKNLEYYKIDRYDEVNDQITTIPGQIDISTNNYPDNDHTLIPGFMYHYILQPYPNDAFYPDSAWGKSLSNGTIMGKVISPTGQGVSNIKVCAVRQDAVPQDTTTTYCAITDTAGSFEINDIYYYVKSKFRIIPSREDHGFDPVYEERTLNLNQYLHDGIFFKDTSAFTVEGQIVQQGNNGLCPVKGVGIYVNDKEEPEVFTDDEGMYAFSVGQIDNYTIEPKLEGHNFSPAKMKYLVTSDTTIAYFTDTSKYILNGSVLATCNTYIGKARLGINAGTGIGGCMDTIITTDTLTGEFMIELPANEYEITLLEFFSEDLDIANTDVEGYFPIVKADLTFGDASENFVYRSSPILEVTGFPEIGCGDYEGIPILKQGFNYILNLSITEAFGGQSCLADTGYVIIHNNVGEINDKIDTVFFKDGSVEYSFITGEPDLIAPHLKNLTFVAHVSAESVTKSFDILVTGNRPRESTFTTVSPEIPFMILRDPPGDASFSYLEENTSIETAMRFSAMASGSINAWAEVKAGAKFESGFGVTVETEIWGKLRGSLEVGAAITQQNEFTLSISNGEIFSTSGNQDVTGEEGDVFAGSALNMIYALTDVVSYNPEKCEVDKSVSLSMGVEGFATTFIYTESHIRNVLIPQLSFLRDLYEKQQNDSAEIYSNQIDVWQQTLKLNQDLKIGSKFLENRSFSSGTSYESFNELSTTSSGSLEFSMYIDATVAFEAGIEVGGSGLSGGVEVKIRTELGLGTSKTEMKSKKTGYVFNDDDGNDYFSVDILADEVFGTPVFNVVSGSSSCPWEPGTQPRESLQITSDIYVAEVDDPNGQAVFHLRLGNISQSDEDMIYNLIFDQGSNPDGAVITAGGSQVQGGIPTPYYIQSGGSKESTVTVRRGPEAFDYDRLLFTLVSGCFDPVIADSVFLSVHFNSPCSSVRMAFPGENWALSKADNDRLKVKLDNYNRDLLDFIKIQISLAGTNNWQTVAFLENSNLNPDNTEITLLLDQYNDQRYDLRAQAGCSAGLKYSQTLTGVIDRKAPAPYGLPEPSDLVLDDSDLIMIVFDENVNCMDLVPSQVELLNVSKNDIINTQVGCYGNTIILIPELNGNSFIGDTFNVKISGVEDVYGNVNENEISWTFTIMADPVPPANADTDKDGIENAADNCPWSANPGQEDMDGDGKGDGCDDDIDGDLYLNYEDNCPMAYNPDQKDENQDGTGDMCQDLTGLTNSEISENFRLSNRPNPFGESTIITCEIPVESYVSIRIYDVVGNLIDVLINENTVPNTKEYVWDASTSENGVYYCTMMADVKERGIVVLKTIKIVKID